MKKLIYLIIGICCMGCDSFLEDYSQDLVVPKTMSDLDEVMLGSCYLPYGSARDLIQGSPGWWLHILDDDINTVFGQVAQAPMQSEMNGYYYGFFTWQQEVGRNFEKNSVNDMDAAFWNLMYARINACNVILAEWENIHASTDAEIRDGWRLKGEAHFLRAQFYLVLANVFADAYEPDKAATTLGVPLKLTEYVEHDPDKECQFDRKPLAEVYAQILKDLDVAQECFDKGSAPKSVFRASKEAALLLKSRVCLYMQDWENAKKAAADFLELKGGLSNYLSMTEGPVITVENPEVVFTQGIQNLQHAIGGRLGEFSVSSDLYGLYDSTDMRQTLYFGRSSGISLGNKYERGDATSYVGDLFMLRSAEGYLNLAEACAMLGDASGASSALNTLKSMRIRNYAARSYGQDEVIGEVRNERRRELCFEGHRWFDLRRYAVCRKVPFRKTIEHIFSRYDSENHNLFIHAEVYELEEGDAAYTFSIPKKVLDFDKGMPDNERKTRKYVKLLNLDGEEEDENNG